MRNKPTGWLFFYLFMWFKREGGEAEPCRIAKCGRPLHYRMGMTKKKKKEKSLWDHIKAGFH